MKRKKDRPGLPGAGISLRALFGILFFLLMCGTILLGYLINTFFLERYYMSGRIRELVSVYDSLREGVDQGILDSSEMDTSLEQSLRRSNLSLLILDSSTRRDKVWSADETVMEERLYANLFGLTPVLPGAGGPEKDGDISGQDDREGQPDGRTEAEGFYSDYVITQILEQEKPYTINLVLNRRTGSKSLEMWGPLGESRFFLLRSPLEDIRSSAAAANRFYGYTGFTLAIAGTLLASWLSRKITDPIRQLSEISIRMKQLDFSAKYDGSGRAELDVLGRNMNELSRKLEDTISALRTANNDLQRDLDRRNRQEEMRQEFLANVTHELKTPISLIRGYAEGLQDGIAEDAGSRSFYLETIVEESEKMNSIVQKVLMLNQLEFGSSTVAMESFDLAAMIRNYLESASLLARQEGVRLNYDREGSVWAWGDPFLIQEVFQNYYTNALHHVDLPAASGGRRADACAGGQDAASENPPLGDAGPQADGTEKVIDIRCGITGDRVRVTVFNTGRPIPEESVPHIWEKFYKVDKARTRAYGGSGVGLSIVKAIMDLHHRPYGVENFDNGVAFWFELDRSGSRTEEAGLEQRENDNDSDHRL